MLANVYVMAKLGWLAGSNPVLCNPNSQKTEFLARTLAKTGTPSGKQARQVAIKLRQIRRVRICTIQANLQLLQRCIGQFFRTFAVYRLGSISEKNPLVYHAVEKAPLDPLQIGYASGRESRT